MKPTESALTRAKTLEPTIAHGRGLSLVHPGVGVSSQVSDGISANEGSHRPQDLAAERQVAAVVWRALTPLLAGRLVMRTSPDGGESFPLYHRGRGRRLQVALSAEPPLRPAAVPVGDVHSLTGRMLVLDLDTGHAPMGVLDRAAYVAEVAAAIVALVERCGGRAIVDVSPSGGRHVYVIWSVPRPFGELKALVAALQVRFGPVLDTNPMSNPSGFIRPPGAPHRISEGTLTGYLRLVTPLEEAVDIATCGNGPAVWNALTQELAAEHDHLTRSSAGDCTDNINGSTLTSQHQDVDTAAATKKPSRPATALRYDDDRYPWWPRVGGRRPLGARYAEIAQKGTRADRGSYASFSEARFAVLCSAAGRGWRLGEVLEAMDTDPAWAGLAELYADARAWKGREAIEHEWDAAIKKTTPDLGGGNPGPQSYTSEPFPTPPAPPIPLHPPHPAQPKPPLDTPRGEGAVRQWQYIRTWWNAMLIGEADPERRDQWRAAGIEPTSAQLVLRALGAAAQMRGLATVEFGVRALELMTGLHPTTVARVLKTLASEPAALIDLTRRGRRKRADAYTLTIPETYAAEAGWRRWRAGRIEALHKAFLALGGAAALVYEQLTTTTSCSPKDLGTATGLDSSTLTRSLTTLAAHGLALRQGLGAWLRGPADLDAVAAATGGQTEWETRLDRHRTERGLWWDLIALWDARSHAKAEAALSPYADDDRYIPADAYYRPACDPESLDEEIRVEAGLQHQVQTVMDHAVTQAIDTTLDTLTHSPDIEGQDAVTIPAPTPPPDAVSSPPPLTNGHHTKPRAEPLDPYADAARRGAAQARKLLVARPEDRARMIAELDDS